MFIAIIVVIFIVPCQIEFPVLFIPEEDPTFTVNQKVELRVLASMDLRWNHKSIIVD